MAKKLVAKFLTNNITDEELIKLKEWLQNPKNQEYFKAAIETNWQLDYVCHQIDVEKAYKTIETRISNSSRVRFLHYKNILKYAAVFLLVISTSIGIYYQTKYSEPIIIESVPEENPQVTLRLGDGTVQVLDRDSQTTIKNGKGVDVVNHEYDKLNYNISDRANHGEIIYNELMVPYGKRFNIELADGTLVYLNAGTRLKYPISFTNLNSREVYLDGEAFFEVKENPSHPFIVHTEKMDVRVLGTSFNVSSYNKDNNTSAVLVRGSIIVYKPSETLSEENSIVILPKQQVTIQSNEFSVREVNVQKHIAWVQGRLYFVNDRFENIIKEMERHYNIVIENNAPGLNEVRYTGTFESETIEQVLNTFKRNTDFKYHKEANKIVIVPSLNKE